MPGRVLIVDDDPLFLVLLRGDLAGEGWDVRTTDTAAELEALIDEVRPDPVLCDLCIPERDAMEFLPARSARASEDSVRGDNRRHDRPRFGLRRH